MADAKKCDRCGKYYERNHGQSMCGAYVSRVQLRSCFDTDLLLKIFDLCDDCVDELFDFLHIEKVTK